MSEDWKAIWPSTNQESLKSRGLEIHWSRGNSWKFWGWKAACLGAEIRELGEPGRAGTAPLAIARRMKTGDSDSPPPQPIVSSSRDASAAPGVSRWIFAGLWQKEERHQFNDLQRLLETRMLPKSTPQAVRPHIPVPQREAGLAKCSHPLDLHFPAYLTQLLDPFCQYDLPKVLLPRSGLRP